MSVINQVMTELEKRAADALPGGYAIRVVHLPENRRKAAMLMGGVLVLVGLAAWLGWRWQHHKTPAPEIAVQTPARPISVTKAVPQQPAAAEPVATVAVATVVPGVQHKDEAAPKEIAKAADDLVPGMHSASGIIPQPSASQAKPLADTGGQNQHKTTKKQHATQKTAAVAAGDADEQAGKPKHPEHAAESKTSAPAPVAGGKLDKRSKQASVQQQADNEFHKAVALMQQGHIEEALAGFEAALKLDARHDAARQAMVALLLENKRNTEAERVLQEGLQNNLKNSGFAMVLARLQVERDSPWSALLTLQKTLPYASQQADYQAFVAALLQRLNRHKEAVAHYQKALQLAPNSGVWLMGQGISLQALQRKEEARDVFKRAMETHTLNEDLQAFVKQRLKEL